ncbi:MAG: Gldg family protein, partial [Roseimicrobium sp.]
KIIAFLDPQCLVGKAYENPGQLGMAPTTIIPPSSDMPELLKAWGVRYDQSQITADMTYRTQAGRGRPVPTFLTVDRAGINRNEPVTSALEIVQLFGAGSFGIDNKEGLNYIKLIESSENSQTVDSTTAEQAQREGLKSFNSDGKKKTLALRLTGKFKTAFPDGLPKDNAPPAPKVPGGTGGEDKKDAGAPAGEKKDDKPASLKESTADAVVFLFADVDMEYDMFALETDQSGRPMPVARNSNIPLLLNTVELLTGGRDLIDVRSRAVTKRPFTKIQEIKADVESKYRPLVEEKQRELQKVVEDITALGVKQDGKGMGVITINKDQLRDLREKQTAIQKDIREFQKEQSREKDRLEMVITALNILGVPLLLVALGLTLAVRRQSLRAAH